MKTEQEILQSLEAIDQKGDLKNIKRSVKILYLELDSLAAPDFNEPPIRELYYIIGQLTQIIEAQTHERAAYYLNRLKKSLTIQKTSPINDINLNRWKEYGHILTDSLWMLGKREKPNTNTAWYWGNFVPDIPSQLITRYTKKGEYVLDPFAGSGTTLFEARNLGRNCVGVDINQEVVDRVNVQLATSDNPWFSHDPGQSGLVHLAQGDSCDLNVIEGALQTAGTMKAQLAILHPPYWDIIKFNDKADDLSNAEDLDEFLRMFDMIVSNVHTVLDNDRYMAIVIGDKYADGELIPLGFHCMQIALQNNFKLKSIVVKNYDNTKGKQGQEELWRYRALVGGFYVFKHEYIFVFQK